MLAQAYWSLIVGLGISILAFAPVLIWQYRRYGSFFAGRLLWTVATFVYVSALIAYTLFPLPDTSGGYCEGRGHTLILDPTVYFIDMWHHLRGLPLLQIITSFDVMQMVLNVLLFVPLGMICSDFLIWKFWPSVGFGFLVSSLVELTQYTGNFGLTSCQYRVADVNDLITNTLGTALGYLIALLIPRFVESPKYLRTRRHLARPVTRWRRLAGMFLDYVILNIVILATGLLIGMVVVADKLLGLHLPLQEYSKWNPVLIFVMLEIVILRSAFSGSGASWGQRIVWLKPEAAPRWKLLVRAISVQGVWALTAFRSDLLTSIVTLWVLFDILWVCFDPRGLSYRTAGLRLVDSRTLSPGGSQTTARAYEQKTSS
ncbi:hypothetical protein BSR28_08060 [Boudabousia liubingyangii]|uniref:VanZ family protein n=1 Tax=Boudabousia liubingyangii TaxID=1921764 RepID=UPI000940197C|nr:VanZ family protein [Boudabousia liubingyangii]OKL46465.1 hypothetical protein BSR28_08060 [Boudabousia liubingyangii]